MINDFFWKKLVPAIILSALVYLVFNQWHNWALGAVALVFYFLFISAKVQAALVNYFDFKKSLRIRLLAAFLGLATLGWILGIFIFFNYFNALAVFLSFFVNALGWSLGKAEKDIDLQLADDEEIIHEAPHAKISVLIYLGLVIYSFSLLLKSKTGGVISSPWQVIDPSYVLFFLLATFLLGALIWSGKVSAKTLLFFVVLQSFLLHSYLPLTHDLFYGADGWRHMATESRLLDGKQVLIPTVVGEQSIIDKSNIGVLSYANFWGTNAVLAKMLQVDLINLAKWLLPIAWSIIFTILLYEIGLALGWNSRKSLLLAWTGMLPFALQAGGSFSLPVNFGFLIFVASFLLLLKRMQNPNRKQENILLALGVGAAVGYPLFFVLYWLCWAVMAVVRSGKKLIIIPGLILASLALPILELAAKFSLLDKNVNILAQTKQFIGNIFALYLAGGPRPHDISGGNILFNQMPAQIFTPNFLTESLWWLPAFVVVAAAFIIWGIKKNIKDKLYQFVLAMFVILLTSYFLSFYLLGGDHLLSRRLDSSLAFLFIILFGYGLKDLWDNRRANWAVAVLAVAITASYTLGPDTFTVSTDQLAAAKYVWSQEQNNSSHCVLGDTYPLLALEAVSDKEIIGGGFPIDVNFGQPERENLYKQMSSGVSNDLIKTATNLTKADHCWLVDEKDNFAKQKINADKTFGDMAVVKYNTKN